LLRGLHAQLSDMLFASLREESDAQQLPGAGAWAQTAADSLEIGANAQNGEPGVERQHELVVPPWLAPPADVLAESAAHARFALAFRSIADEEAERAEADKLEECQVLHDCADIAQKPCPLQREDGVKENLACLRTVLRRAMRTVDLLATPLVRSSLRELIAAYIRSKLRLPYRPGGVQLLGELRKREPPARQPHFLQ